jgi:tetratricopeptide (TPR) repeat protein
MDRPPLPAVRRPLTAHRHLLTAICCLLPAVCHLHAQDIPRLASGFDRAVLRAMIRDADSLFRAHRYREAESAYRAVIAADSNSAAGRSGLAEAIVRSPTGQARYAVALAELQRALRLAPENPVLHVRYGEAALPWRYRRPREGAETDSALLGLAAGHLEQALALSPGRAEPHLGLYLVHLARGDTGRAQAQLRELMRKEFFPQPVRDFAYDLLVSADTGGCVFTNGDMDSYPAWALQSGGLRTDVTVVNIPLLNAGWYARWLKRSRRLPVTFSESQLQDLSGKYDARLQRTIGPGERIVQNVVANRDAVPGGVFFSLTVDRDLLEQFKSNLSLEGFVYRVTRRRPDIPVNLARCRDNLNRKYRVPDFTGLTVWKTNSSAVTRDYRALAADCAAAFFALAHEHRQRSELVEAARLLRQACSIAIAAGKWQTFERVLDYWLKMTPDDLDVLRLARDYYGK